MEKLREYFGNPEQLIQEIFRAGGTKPGGYGYISGGYGGGVDINQFHNLLWVDGFIMGLWAGNKPEAFAVMRAINEEIRKVDASISDERLPYKASAIIG